MSVRKETRNGKTGRAHLLVRRLWAGLETVEGRRLTALEMSEHLNLSDSALSEWILGKTDLNQIEALLRLCERLGCRRSFELFRPHLRVFPSLRSPELAHDPASVEILDALLQKTKGFTLITGSETHRTFLLTAFAHSYLAFQNPRRSLAGWDIHVPSWFVPVSGLHYQQDQHCEPLRLGVNAPQNSMIISNGFWKRFRKHRDYLVECASSCHVVVADAIAVQEFQQHLAGTRTSVDLVDVTGDTTRLNVIVTTLAEANLSGFKRQ